MRRLARPVAGSDPAGVALVQVNDTDAVAGGEPEDLVPAVFGAPPLPERVEASGEVAGRSLPSRTGIWNRGIRTR